MKPNTTFFSSITDPLTLLQSGEADISLYPDGRTWAAYDSGATWIRFLNPREGAVMCRRAMCNPASSMPAARSG
jgi:putative spermidine/putrescine transport system substrate-binding protein